jgi:diacylglycerol kinase family enzyme
MQITLIHNPEAGTGNQPSGEQLVTLIRAAGHAVTYQSSKHADWQQRLDEPADLIALAGGDGLVGLVIKRLVGKRIPVTILPVGTANNIATTLHLKGIPLDQLIAGWVSGRRAKFDIGSASGPWGTSFFFEGIGLGVFTDTMSRLDARNNADLTHHADAEKKIQATLQILKIRLEASPALPMKIALDGRNLTGEYVLVEAMNIRSIGPNLSLAPNADPGDGLLDVVLVPDRERQRLADYLLARSAGNQSLPELPIQRGRHLHVECDELRVHIDDDVWPSHGEHPPYSPMIIDVRIHSENLEMLLPGVSLE